MAGKLNTILGMFTRHLSGFRFYFDTHSGLCGRDALVCSTQLSVLSTAECGFGSVVVMTSAVALCLRLGTLTSFLHISHLVGVFTAALNPGRTREGVKKYEHSRTVGEGAGIHAKTVRRWVRDFCRDGKFVVSNRAYLKRQAFSFIDDEDVRERCREYIDQRVTDGRRGSLAFASQTFRGEFVAGDVWASGSFVGSVHTLQIVSICNVCTHHEKVLLIFF